MKPRLALGLFVLLAALTFGLSAATAVWAYVPSDPPDSSAPPSILTTTVTTYTVFLPFITHNYMVFEGPDIPFAYGWNVYHYADFRSASATTFDWVKFTDPPGPESICGNNRLSYNVLLRLNHAEANTTVQYVADRTWEWAQALKQQSGETLCVQAFEIGNEPNLYGMYQGPIDAVHFADQLCAAYTAIKATDPNFIVVSGGLAPTGNIDDPNVAVNSELFLRRMLDRIRATHNGDAGACFDVLGYHNYGFRTGYPTDPADANACPGGMCFRGAERIFDILWGEYGVNKKIWTTETGWLRDFYAGGCGAAPWEPFFQGFQVSDAEQANQMVGAFQYARAHWAWNGGIFVFNLDFNQRGREPCYDEQNWFAVQGYPARTALEQMPRP